MTDKETLTRIAAQFGVKATPDGIRPLGNGLINDTYTVASEDGNKYVLQRINNVIFKDVDLLQHNIDCVTAHIRHKLAEAGTKDVERRSLRFLTVGKTGKSYLHDGDNYWRMMDFIPNSVTRETLDAEGARITGEAFGEFEAMLADIQIPLGETIPGFHDMELRLRQFEEAIAADRAGRAEGVRDLIDELLDRGEAMTEAERMHRRGELPKRICHCDTKLNNILFDRDGNVLCVIDLDTVMPSFVFSDFGDFLRTAANTGAEDASDLSTVGFDMNIFRAFAEGYLKTATFLTPTEKSMLPYAATLFPYMQAVRFLTDYLNGDTYYKVAYPDHNLVRARAQFRLLQSAEEKRGEMAQYIASLCEPSK